MQEDEVFDGILMEDSWLTLEQVASACTVEPQWLLRHIGAELFPHAECVAGVWRFSSAELVRARRMRQIERDFDGDPDRLTEMDALIAYLQMLGTLVDFKAAEAQEQPK